VTWLVKGAIKCFGIPVDLKRGDENCYTDHIFNEKGG
jgi:hypothetical protein